MRAAQIILLGERRVTRVGWGVAIFPSILLATATAAPSTVVTVQREWWVIYPDWIMVLGATAVAAVGIWLLMKLLKLMLWLLFFAVVVGGVLTAAWMLIR